MKTKEEIIKETAEFYNLSNRGYDEKESLCMYLTPDNKKCAVGRCILDEKIKSFNKVYFSNIIAVSDHLENRRDSLDNYFKPEYRGHKARFWRDLQSFHDSACNWTEEGISDIGKSTVEILIDLHKDK